MDGDALLQGLRGCLGGSSGLRHTPCYGKRCSDQRQVCSAGEAGRGLNDPKGRVRERQTELTELNSDLSGMREDHEGPGERATDGAHL